MADKCSYCKKNIPTNHLVLNGGDLWIEFCEPCGKTEVLTNTKGEQYTVQEVYEKSNINVKTKKS